VDGGLVIEYVKRDAGGPVIDITTEGI
jgi:hypothetical protein